MYYEEIIDCDVYDISNKNSHLKIDTMKTHYLKSSTNDENTLTAL